MRETRPTLTRMYTSQDWIRRVVTLSLPQLLQRTVYSHHCHSVTEMPAICTQKSIARRTTFACNYPEGGLLECITVSKETEDQFKDIGKICRVKISKEKKVVTYSTDLEVCVEADADIARLDLLSRITMTECCKELESRLKEFKPLPTLTDRLHIPLPVDLKKIPSGIYFKKTVILRRMSDIEEKVLLTY